MHEETLPGDIDASVVSRDTPEERFPVRASNAAMRAHLPQTGSAANLCVQSTNFGGRHSFPERGSHTKHYEYHSKAANCELTCGDMEELAMITLAASGRMEWCQHLQKGAAVV